jgi:peroxiredoxin Q/BCP
MLKVGDKAPNFEGFTDENKKVSLIELLEKNNLVLYFYPKDETPGCTAEACSFRDEWDDLLGLDANVVGISSDSVESHKKFKENRKLPFTLISDPSKSIRKLYEASGMLLPSRVTYIIKKDGTIVHVYNSQLNAKNHVREAVEALKKIKPLSTQKEE